MVSSHAGREAAAAAVLAQDVRRGNTPGVQYAIADAESEWFHFEAGLADLAQSTPVSAQTAFNIYSGTKIFTAAAVLRLAEQGALRLEDSISAFVDFNPYGDGVTVDQLLMHTGGVPNPLPMRWIHLAAEDAAFDPDAFVRAVVAAHPKPIASPGARRAYSNIGYMLLGLAIERAGGASYREHIVEHLLRPLGIEADALDFRIDAMSAHAQGCLDRWQPLTWFARTQIDMKRFSLPARGKWQPLRPFYVNGPAFGGLIGNARACVRFLQEFLRSQPRLLSPQTRAAMFEEQRAGAPSPVRFTRGWYAGDLNGEPYVWHPGGGGGYYCELRVYPRRGLASAVLSNRTGIFERYLDRLDRFFL